MAVLKEIVKQQSNGESHYGIKTCNWKLKLPKTLIFFIYFNWEQLQYSNILCKVYTCEIRAPIITAIMAAL